jgi:hypothetical protein
MKNIALIAFLALIFIGCESTKQGFKSFGRDVGDAATNVGHDVRDTTKSTVKSVDKSVGSGLESAGDSIKEATE